MGHRSRAEDAVVHAISRLVEPLNRALPGPTEVVLHDLAAMPSSIIAIAGSLTGRRIGGPPTDMLLRAAATGDFATLVGYESQLPDGRRIRSTTIIVRGDDDRPLAALCINSDVSIWEPVRAFVDAVLPGGAWPGRPVDQPAVEPGAESYPGDIDELAERLLRDAVEAAGVPVELMHKRHKLAVVERLHGKGFFLLREAVDRAADALGVTRFTIYNYLNEVTVKP